MMDTKALREKVLDLAIRGKLVPQDPNDEPASILLERIRQQKQQMVKDGKLKAKDIKNDTVIFVGEDNLHYKVIIKLTAHRSLLTGGLLYVNYSSMTSNIILAPSLKPLWNIRQSVIV